MGEGLLLRGAERRDKRLGSLAQFGWQKREMPRERYSVPLPPSF